MILNLGFRKHPSPWSSTSTSPLQRHHHYSRRRNLHNHDYGHDHHDYDHRHDDEHHHHHQTVNNLPLCSDRCINELSLGGCIDYHDNCHHAVYCHIIDRALMMTGRCIKYSCLGYVQREQHTPGTTLQLVSTIVSGTLPLMVANKSRTIGACNTQVKLWHKANQLNSVSSSGNQGILLTHYCHGSATWWTYIAFSLSACSLPMEPEGRQFFSSRIPGELLSQQSWVALACWRGSGSNVTTKRLTELLVVAYTSVWWESGLLKNDKSLIYIAVNETNMSCNAFHPVADKRLESILITLKKSPVYGLDK